MNPDNVQTTVFLIIVMWICSVSAQKHLFFTSALLYKSMRSSVAIRWHPTLMKPTWLHQHNYSALEFFCSNPWNSILISVVRISWLLVYLAGLSSSPHFYLSAKDHWDSDIFITLIPTHVACLIAENTRWGCAIAKIHPP